MPEDDGEEQREQIVRDTADQFRRYQMGEPAQGPVTDDTLPDDATRRRKRNGDKRS